MAQVNESRLQWGKLSGRPQRPSTFVTMLANGFTLSKDLAEKLGGDRVLGGWDEESKTIVLVETPPSAAYRGNKLCASKTPGSDVPTSYNISCLGWFRQWRLVVTKTCDVKFMWNSDRRRLEIEVRDAIADGAVSLLPATKKLL